MLDQPGLFDAPRSAHPLGAVTFAEQLGGFVYKGKETEISSTAATLVNGQGIDVPTFTNEFWTSRQRAAHSLHEISYRACFKPQLPRFFIERLTNPGDRVYDPFMGRGTTPLEAALLKRRATGCDVNPLSQVLVAPRLSPPTAAQVEERLRDIDLTSADEVCREDLLAFYHPDTLKEICALRAYLSRGASAGRLDSVDRWIQMVAVNRLTGHSPGFFSVYTLPPNQAVSVDVQLKINAERKQVPSRRDVRSIIIRKTKSLLTDCDAETRVNLADAVPVLIVGRCDDTPILADGCIDLVVTSPPFLDVVNYSGDNWLRCWFCEIDSDRVAITMAKKLEQWQEAMTRVFHELFRVVRPGGHVAFEVGEVRGGRIKLEQTVIPAAASVGFLPMMVLINSQVFTKTANCWGVKNNQKGTNTNRIVLLQRPR